MKKTIKSLVTLSLLGGSICANAVITPVGVFAGAFNENFDAIAPGPYVACPTFAGAAMMNRLWAGGLVEIGIGALPPLAGSCGLYGNNTNVSYAFGPMQVQFGGYFRRVPGSPPLTHIGFRFYSGAVLVGGANVPITAGYVWRGWNSTIPFNRVDVIGINAGAVVPGWVGMDSLTSL